MRGGNSDASHTHTHFLMRHINKEEDVILHKMINEISSNEVQPSCCLCLLAALTATLYLCMQSVDGTHCFASICAGFLLLTPDNLFMDQALRSLYLSMLPSMLHPSYILLWLLKLK